MPQFMNTGRRPKTPGSETKQLTTYDTRRIMFTFATILLSLQVPKDYAE